MIAQTYVQIARMSWSGFEDSLEGFPKDRHVWHYVKGVLQPLVLSLKDRIIVDQLLQEKHEEAVERFIASMDSGKNIKRTQGFVQLTKKHTKPWKVIERFIFMKGFFVVGTYLEEVWENIKLVKTLGIILIVPTMYALNETSKPFTVTLGALTLIGFIATFFDWHRPYWDLAGNIVTSPPMIFRNWLKTWAFQHFIMKFPFDIFFIAVADPKIINGVRLLRMFHVASLFTKLARFKARRTLRFGLIMQVFQGRNLTFRTCVC